MVSTVAATASPGDAMLTRVDAALNRYQTLWLRMDVSTRAPTQQQPGGAERATHMEIEVHLSGRRRRVELHAPADARGTRVLLDSEQRMYVYLPQLRKIRRVVSHLQERSLLGTALQQADFTLRRYGRDYQASVARQSTQQLVLKLTPRAAGSAPYGRIEMTIGRRLMLPTKLRYFSAGGVLLKSEERLSYRCDSGMCVPERMKIVDHSAGGQKTTLRVIGLQVNKPFAGGLLSKRGLLP